MKLASIVAPLSPCLFVLLGCASSGSGAPPDATIAIDGGSDARPPDAGDPGTEAACPPGQFAIAVAADGTIACAAVDSETAVAVRSRCSVYLGHRDNCGGCTDAPSSWSQSTPLTCSPGEGAGNACVSAALDDPEAPVLLAAVDLAGDVNDDDKVYTTLHCVTAPRAPRPAPCAPGWAISGRVGESWTCSPVAEAAVGYVRARCGVYLGWRDSCDGCTTAPSKWGVANDAACANGAGTDNTCVTATLAGETVNLFGLNTDGDVNGDDKLYVGLACQTPADSTVTSMSQCPDGQFVTATHADGSFACADPAPAFAAYVRDRCSLVLGWRDSCDACTQPPAKWGVAGTAACATGAGTDDTCADATLGDVTLRMFGLSTDGNVNGDDALYLGLRCAP